VKEVQDNEQKIINKLADNIDPSLFELADYDESQAEITGYSNYSFGVQQFKYSLKIN